MTTPCIVITRDRVSVTRQCIASLERFPGLDIIIVDHGSTWPAMIDYLSGSPHRVVSLLDRAPRQLWDGGGLSRLIGTTERYLVTDPDLVFDDACPADWLDALRREMDAPPTLVKVGMGIRTDDLPDTPLAAKVAAWEAEFWKARTFTGNAWRAPVDTTMALYPPLSVEPRFELAPAARLDAPYLMRHLPWYETGPEDDETRWYREHAILGASHWINGGW